MCYAWSPDRRSFTEGAEVLAVDEPPPNAVRMKLVAAVESSHRSSVQSVEAYATNIFFILIRIVAETCPETGENVVVVGVGNVPDADMQTVDIGKKGREAVDAKRQDLNADSFMFGYFIEPRRGALIAFNNYIYAMSLDSCGFAEGAEVLAGDEPPPYTIRIARNPN
ncbi:hypothetical protein SASPL_130158 [Salvia splendens]|uniref:Uncharacterized protein n=1 Tax=Salvia splendens TaxID=180675 RepID=A0A8X8ZKE0_SALSN|nr:hypothetical protein SASPL_130158 [Salvia splendens]